MGIPWLQRQHIDIEMDPRCLETSWAALVISFYLLSLACLFTILCNLYEKMLRCIPKTIHVLS